MQRWWYLDNKGKSDEKSERRLPSKSIETNDGGVRKCLFRVLVTEQLNTLESICLTGECSALGNWIPQHCVLLQRENDIKYRYFVCLLDNTTENIHVRRWETHLKPRQINAYDEVTSVTDTFGEIDGLLKVDCGWLTTETVIQFKFFNNPFHLKQKLRNRTLFVKLTPMNLRTSNETSLSLDDSLSSDTRENTTESSSFAFAEVVTLKYPHSVIEQQQQFGQKYNRDDIIVFNVTVEEPDNIAYIIDLYMNSSKRAPDEPPVHLGYHYVLPNVLRKSDGELELPITCASSHRPLGMMNIEYLKITPLKSHDMTMKQSFIRYWNRKWTGLDVGHRGSGNSFKVSEKDTMRENTIASLKHAASHGADFVEFDVQLSKDLVPVIYHDLLVYVSLKKKKCLESHDMLELPLQELTLEQLSNLKIYHTVEGRNREAKFFDEDLDEHQPFPQLADALNLVDMSVGFNIEVKCAMQLKDGTLELDRTIDKNLYVDCILDVVLSKAGTRRIVFSCFDPDICTMLRFKQNIYPVMFLTLGVTDKYPQYHDPRCNTIESAVSNAHAMELLGIVAHTEDLLRDSSQINLATDLGLIVFCWGDDNNSKDTIQLLKSLGIHGIIYDKMDVLSTKEVKKSIFLVKANETQKNLFQLQQLEMIQNGEQSTNDPESQ
ncbi:Glycerophosphocholine phosphodiesterase GPCPD1 [Pseudolycoriella hygida]|uniref:Glycerophosphocholine phosphodiesterase GPCPD1 n=1 Tax=Pseudolycoriella hygida TaxID=35572 RepID=A0A9Q0S7K2_9DIPT|nr:Glycerophosphocholine phosphodiesterase GPCPD1 [Pseudolycoriella hygida]